MRFAAVTQEQLDSSASTQASALVNPAALAQPRTFFEMVLFSVAVSVATQLVMHLVFRPRRDADTQD